MAHLVFVQTTRPGIQALAAAKRLGYRSTLLTSAKFDWLLNDADRAAASEQADAVVRIDDTQSPDAVAAALEALLREGPVDGVLSTFHLCALPAAVAAGRLGLRATSAAGMLAARDKNRTRDIMDEHGIPTVRHRLVRSRDEALDALRHVGYPAIIKPIIGSGKMMTRIVRDDAETIAHMDSIDAQHDALREAFKDEIPYEFAVEELAQGPLYSMELGSDAFGGWAPYMIVRRKTGKHNPVLEMGSTVPSGLTPEQYDEAAAYCIRIVEALGLTLGIFHVEFIQTSDGPRLVEVNPRVAGGAIPDLIRTATGFELFEELVRIHAGEPVREKRLHCNSAASHTFVAVMEDGTVRADLPGDWFEPFRRRITNGYCDIKPGQALHAMDGNFDVYGVLRVAADDYREAVTATESLRTDVEAALGLKLVETDA
jgi:biotin carboxylase